MADRIRDDFDEVRDHHNPGASANRWRHQESSSFARHAAADSHGVEAKPITVPGMAVGDGSHGSLEVKCGPLLNYRRMEDETWFGSVLVVTNGGGLGESPEVPELRFSTTPAGGNYSGQAKAKGGNNGNGYEIGSELHGVVNGVDYSHFGQSDHQAPTNGNNGVQTNGDGGHGTAKDSRVAGTKLYSDTRNTFWRFDLQVSMQQSELRVDYEIPKFQFTRGKKDDKQSFYVPAIQDSMRIMFHSCNGFSVGTDEDAYSGACLWNDVQRAHALKPFHVMYVTITRYCPSKS